MKSPFLWIWRTVVVAPSMRKVNGRRRSVSGAIRGRGDPGSLADRRDGVKRRMTVWTKMLAAASESLDLLQRARSRG
jgi:hypothetical protein